MTPEKVLEFWQSVGNEGWWKKDEVLDRKIVETFLNLHREIAGGFKDEWLKTAEGTLAMIIVLDQFSRNMFRGSPEAFSQDSQALGIAQHAIQNKFDDQYGGDLRIFFYLPYEHSEKIREQELSMRLQYSIGANPEALKAALEHHDIIKRFGRFPHRNPVLGRHTTYAEQAFLNSGGFKG